MAGFTDDIKERHRIKRGINRLSVSADTWLIKSNIAKCVVPLTKTGQDQSLPAISTIQIQLLPVVDKQKDQGVWMHKPIRPSLQCTNAAIRATAVMRSIKRTFMQLDVRLFWQMFHYLLDPPGVFRSGLGGIAEKG